MSNKCAAPAGCNRKARATGYCGRHWKLAKLNAAPRVIGVDELPNEAPEVVTGYAVEATGYIALAKLAAKESGQTLDNFVGTAVLEASKAVLLRVWTRTVPPQGE